MINNRNPKQMNTAATFSTTDCLKLKSGLFSRSDVGVVIEKELHVYINRKHLFTASIVPGMEKEFITGYLFGQCFIDDINELESINITGNKADVVFSDTGKTAGITEGTSYRIVSGGGKIAVFGGKNSPKISSRLKVEKNAVFKAMNTVFEKATLYRETEGVHGGGLFTTDGAPVCIVEDIGRHNTLDKLIGYALLNGIDRGSVFLACTGRMASEMVTKICRAGIPMAVTKTAVTDKGLEIGRQCGLTIIGFVRDTGTSINTNMETRVIAERGMKIYTNPERIISN